MKLIGIKSTSSSVGYICSVNKKNLEDFFKRLVESKVEFEEVSRLKGKVHYVLPERNVETKPVLNELLFTSSSPGVTTRYIINLNGIAESHKSSGVYIASAVGSTASILGAGGKIAPRSDKKFQFFVREPYQPNGVKLKILKGFFDPDVDKLIIENRTENAVLAFDGSRDPASLQFGDSIEFARASSIWLVKSFK